MTEKVVTAIVPAAGWGTRMRPLTDALPKELLPLGRRTCLQHIIRELASAGIQRVVFVVSSPKEAIIRNAFGETDPQTGMVFSYAIQKEMRGLGDALLSATPFLKNQESFLVALGDAVFIEPEIGGLSRRLRIAVEGKEPCIAIAVRRVPQENLSRYGVIQPTEKSLVPGAFFAINDIVEKPRPEDAPSDFAVAARYLLPYAVLEALHDVAPDAKGEVQLTDALRRLLRRGTAGIAVPLQEGEARYDIGNFEGYYQAFLTFALSDSELNQETRDALRESIRIFKEPTVE